MLLRKINQKQALLAWHLFVEKMNAAQPLVERRRKHSDGSEQVFFTRTKLISGNVKDTGTRIILDYIKAYEQSVCLGFTPEHENDLPSLFTNSSKLSDMRSFSERTMRNHISKLRKLGLISGYQFHGTFHDFELWISPEIIFADQNQCKKMHPKAQNFNENFPGITPDCTNFPLNVSFETTGNLEKKSTTVDKGVAAQPGAVPVGDGQNGNAGNTNTSNTGPQRAGKRAKERLERPLAAKKQATGAGGAAAPAKPSQNPVFLSFVENFWQYAKTMLYPGYDFDETHDKLAKNGIWTGVYGSFRIDFDEKEWEGYHAECMKRIDLAEAYYRKRPDKYPPMPYAEFVSGSGYFDRENKFGFCKTHDWLVQQDTWSHQRRVSDALRRARSDFWLYKEGKAIKRIQEKSPVQLFEYHRNRISKLGKDALQKFYKQHAPVQES
ncbi:hypothetical protein [Pontibacter russatus]|uniref:hypothetical protein n=1 Tax=Pontibacter russatus TaxID=2694929 RepID=UPI00137AB9CD|nr:hypothetical protein [Pontibacter russatus]